MSPQNSATGITSRKPAETNRFTAAKFAPDAVAVSISVIWLPRPSGVPPIANAATSTKGSAARIAPMTRVRRRFSCRSSSTRSGSVRRARYPSAVSARSTRVLMRCPRSG